MSSFAMGHASGGSAEELATACAARIGRREGHGLGFVYVTSELAGAFPAIVASLRQQTGVPSWAGTVGHGVCVTGAEHFDKPAVAAMTCPIGRDAFRPIAPIVDPDAIDEAPGPAPDAVLGIVHGDPRHPAVPMLVAALARRSGLYLVGGLTSADGDFPQAAADRIAEGGVSGVLLRGGGHRIAVGLTQGCSPIGPAHTVTDCDGQVIAALDGRPAFDVLRESAGAAPDADPRSWLANLHPALPVSGSDKADYVVRNLIGIDTSRGFIAISEAVAPGDRVLLVRRDRESAERDLERMLSDLKARTSVPPRAGLYFSCLARGPNLFRGNAHEMAAIRRTFSDIPVVGFFGNGEIANDRVYGYTGVLTLFS
jgi:small ligand-binding sensory domain FIST